MLDEAQVRAIARLARIRLEPNEETTMRTQLTRILELVEAMNAVVTDGVEPLAHPLEPAAWRREDIVTEPDQRDEFQVNAPLAAAGYYLVPRVIE